MRTTAGDGAALSVVAVLLLAVTAKDRPEPSRTATGFVGVAAFPAVFGVLLPMLTALTT